MPVIGYKLCGEEQSPQELIDCARRAEEVGFDFAMISDHYHPWAAMLPGRFILGVGSGENLNEHILGDHWPEIEVRHEMLEEAVEVIRLLWQGGQQSHYGNHYTVENARIYTLPGEPPLILIATGGPQAAELAGRIGDGLCATSTDKELKQTFEKAG